MSPVSLGMARVCSGAPCQPGRAEEWLSRACVQREAFACLPSSLPSLPACPPPLTLTLPGTFVIAPAVATVTWSFAPQVMRVTPRSVSVGCCHLFIEPCRRSVDEASSGHVGRLRARPAGASPPPPHAPFPSCQLPWQSGFSEVASVLSHAVFGLENPSSFPGIHQPPPHGPSPARYSITPRGPHGSHPLTPRGELVGKELGARQERGVGAGETARNS